MIRVYKITPDTGCASCINKEEDVMEWVRNADMGAVLTIEVKEMSQEEYGSLPEYTGP